MFDAAFNALGLHQGAFHVAYLSLKHNALHTLHHAIEHLANAEETDYAAPGRTFDDQSFTVSHRVPGESLSFQVPDFTRLPPRYERKFALLHLIQAAELLLKARIQAVDPAALFAGPNRRRTIDMHDAIRWVTKEEPDLLSEAEVALLVEAKAIRNGIEHYEFLCADDDLDALCADFLAICMLFSQRLIGVNLVDTFGWDCLKNDVDPVGDKLARVMASCTTRGRLSAAKTARSWMAENPNPSERQYLCVHCGTLSVSSETDLCAGCGQEGDERESELVGDLDGIIARIKALRSKVKARE